MKRPIKDAPGPESKALPSTGPLSMSQIQGEFGGSNPISLSEYYGAAAGVPGSGTISISDFRGKSGEWVSAMTNHNPQGGSPGTYSGYAAVAARSVIGTGVNPTTQEGTMANRGGALAPSNGVAEWSISAIGRQQGYGVQTIYMGFKDSTKADGLENNTPNYSFAFPSTVTLASNSAFTTGVVTIPASKWISMDTSESMRGCNVAWRFESATADPDPTYNDIAAHFFNDGTVYIKIS